MTDWVNLSYIEARQYVCSFCSARVTSDRGYYDKSSLKIYICPCGMPTFFAADGSQHPGYPLGTQVSGVNAKEVHALYEEARKCATVQAYTATVLACRKLLMHIAVQKGAPSGKPFIEYVQYLSDNHYIPPDGKEWVDQIRRKGNEANHEILLMTDKDAEEIIGFTEMLLRFVYEFPHKIGKVKQTEPSPP